LSDVEAGDGGKQHLLGTATTIFLWEERLHFPLLIGPVKELKQLGMRWM